MGDSTGISILGCGVVGGGALAILAGQADAIRRRTGAAFDVRHVACRDLDKHRGALPDAPLTTDAEAAVDDPAVKIVVELIGGTGRAHELIRRALTQGKAVVTANKSLLAARGPELFALARAHGTSIAFEASCGGGIPIVDALTKGLLANRINALSGILNGTCNVILTRMGANGWSYAQALKEAQDAGFAEADPTLDVSGRDAAQKLAILASLAFGARVGEREVYVEGVDAIQPMDVAFAKELGYVVKLLAVAERVGGGEVLSLRVHPALVHESDVLADVAGPFNAVSVYGDALGHAVFYGRGAGRLPTASAVVADLISVATGTWPATFAALRTFPDQTEPAEVQPFGDLEGRYYLRLAARDLPGVMADVTAALGDAGISLSGIHQREAEAGEELVPIVITTHRAREASVQAALKRINELETVGPPTVCLRIVDAPAEY